jgi:hypothetical protein
MTAQLSKLDRETTGLKVFPLFTLMGWALIGFSILVGILVLGPTAASYWGGNAKAVRDGAEVGSVLLGQLTTLAWWPKLLVPLTFLGIINGLSAIVYALRYQRTAIPQVVENLPADNKLVELPKAA